MTKKYVIRSEFNMFPSNTTNWFTDPWVWDIEKAKIFGSLDEAVAGINKLSAYLKNTGISFYNYTVHEVRKVNALGDKVDLVDDKDTVLSLLDSIAKYDGLSNVDFFEKLIRITRYVKKT